MLPAWMFSATPENEKENTVIPVNQMQDVTTVTGRNATCKQVVCRGIGHIRCSHCFYNDRFGRHQDCTRQCAVIDGVWGPGICSPECQQMPDLEMQDLKQNLSHEDPAAERSSHLVADSVEQTMKELEQHAAGNVMLDSSAKQSSGNHTKALCRGPGHVRCSDCYYTGRFGRHSNCTRQCSMIDGTWGPLTCLATCEQAMNDEKQETESEALTCVSESEQMPDHKKKHLVEE